MARGKPVIINAYWDEEDPNNIGWAWRATWLDEFGSIEQEDSGEMDGRKSLFTKTITTRARRAAGYPGSRISVRISR